MIRLGQVCAFYLREGKQIKRSTLCQMPTLDENHCMQEEN